MQTHNQKARRTAGNRPQYNSRGKYKQSGIFDKSALPNPSDYFEQQGQRLIGGGSWKSTICPFHDDSKPSLRVRSDTGCFRCMVCGAHGGDVLAFHMQRHGLSFMDAAKQLGAWRIA